MAPVHFAEWLGFLFLFFCSFFFLMFKSSLAWVSETWVPEALSHFPRPENLMPSTSIWVSSTRSCLRLQCLEATDQWSTRIYRMHSQTTNQRFSSHCLVLPYPVFPGEILLPHPVALPIPMHPTLTAALNEIWKLAPNAILVMRQGTLSSS